jgi:NAD(P)-dependent dehydrogenase (short-subunit alcohol dehydrogenase family)
MINYIKKFSLKGKKAIVCGGAGLLGREIVLALAQAGAKVIIADVNTAIGTKLAKTLKAKKCAVEFQKFDITEVELLEKSLGLLIQKAGGLDIFVNSAYPRTSDWNNDVEQVSVSSWRRNIDIQLNAYTLSAKFAAKYLKKKGGSIINVGSIYGVVGPDFTIYQNTKINNPAAYAAIKGGILNFDRYLASYYGKYNVRVNTVCPGGVFDHQNPTFVKNYNHKVPMKRMATKDEVASAVLFLASDAASYITGTALMVDGGWTAI